MRKTQRTSTHFGTDGLMSMMKKRRSVANHSCSLVVYPVSAELLLDHESRAVSECFEPLQFNYS